MLITPRITFLKIRISCEPTCYQEAGEGGIASLVDGYADQPDVLVCSHQTRSSADIDINLGCHEDKL
jgi:hypothetical protein